MKKVRPDIHGNTENPGWRIPFCRSCMGERAHKFHRIKTAQERLGWKKATSYTVLRKLCEKGILKNENATVTAIVKKDEVCRQESEQLIHRSFGNSLPAFVAAFLRDKKLTRQEAEELKRLIDAASMSDGRNDS